MFAWKLKKVFSEEAKDLTRSLTSYSGANRRAINLIPLPLSADGHELAQTSAVKFHQLLVSIEGNQRTCCLKIISPKKKSRAALLIYRGRVLGSLYGKKQLSNQFFHQEAHQPAMADLATPGNILNAYQLPEDIVLAAASLFHGQVLQFDPTLGAEETFQNAVSTLEGFNLPGCLVVSSQDDEMLCMVYLSGGKVLGVYSSKDGWVASSLEAARSYLKQTAGAKIMCSILAIRSAEDAARMGYSLTGLGDRRSELFKNLQTKNDRLEIPDMSTVNYYVNPGPSQGASQVSASQIPAAHMSNTRRLRAIRRVQHAHSITP